MILGYSEIQIYRCLYKRIVQSSFQETSILLVIRPSVQINFNKELSKMRQVVERAIALLKGRFRRLKYLHMSMAELIPYVILACCVLHNLCLQEYNDRVDDFIDEGRQYNERDIIEQNQDRESINEIREDIIYNNAQGSAKRNYLAALIV